MEARQRGPYEIDLTPEEMEEYYGPENNGWFIQFGGPHPMSKESRARATARAKASAQSTNTSTAESVISPSDSTDHR